MKKKKEKVTALPTIEKQVEFELSEKEIADLGRRNAELDANALELEIHFDSLKKEHQGKLKDIELERIKNSQRIREGHERRLVTCQVEHDYPAATVRYWRDDKIIEERAMRADELQLDWTKRGSAVEPEEMNA